uniref:ATPase subunit 8 n=1 Tax=Katharina tunicata TaxID=34587 RepID=Q34841_KATTU|nr:ATP synthase F0 subunit 8 [Katharina tunicata]AAC48364.1 ATPase subunit 8 [Katharina tunicata]
MPQLAPMNWIFLLLFFWSNVFCLGVCVWWVKSSSYSFLSKSVSWPFYFKKWVW